MNNKQCLSLSFVAMILSVVATCIALIWSEPIEANGMAILGGSPCLQHLLYDGK